MNIDEKVAISELPKNAELCWQCGTWLTTYDNLDMYEGKFGGLCNGCFKAS